MPDTDGKEFYDYLASQGQLDTAKYPATEDNYKLAIESPSNADTLKAWRDSKAKPEPSTFPDKPAEPPKPAEPAVAKQETAAPAGGKVADAIAMAEGAQPGQPVQPGVKPGEAKDLPFPDTDIKPSDTPADKAIRTKTVLPQGELPTKYKPTKAEPDFWTQVGTIAQQTGKGLLTILADFAYGYAGKTTPTELAQAREHDVLMEGKRHTNELEMAKVQNKQAESILQKQAEIQKGLEAIKQNFDAKQNELNRSMQRDLAKEENDITKQRIIQEYATQRQYQEWQRDIAMMQYTLGIQTDAAQKGGAPGILDRAGVPK